MDELRNASNQVELERVQRNLARLQRLGDKHGALEAWLILFLGKHTHICSDSVGFGDVLNCFG